MAQANVPGFQVPQQDTTTWCWAAVTLGVTQFYQDPRFSSQCQVASQVIRQSCCNDPRPCLGSLDMLRPLFAVGHIGLDPQGRPIALPGFAEQVIGSELSQQRVICLLIMKNGRGHTVGISAIDSAIHLARVHDPENHGGVIPCMYTPTFIDYGNGERYPVVKTYLTRP